MANNEVNEVMTIPGLAEYLRMADSTIYRLAKTGEIPGRKVGGGWRFSRRVIDEWLAEPSSNGDTK